MGLSVTKDPDTAVAGIPGLATVLVGGFGMAGMPVVLVENHVTWARPVPAASLLDGAVVDSSLPTLGVASDAPAAAADTVVAVDQLDELTPARAHERAGRRAGHGTAAASDNSRASSSGAVIIGQ